MIQMTQWILMMLRIAIVLGAALGFVACRPGEGDYCQCPGECRRGLVCAQAGAVIESCVDPVPGEEPGRCIEQDGLPDMVGSLDETAAPEYHDVGGKRDFEPGMPTDDSTSVATDAESSTSTGGSTTGSTSGGSSGSTGGSSGGTSGSSSGR